MHRIYTTHALVIDSRPQGDADRFIALYTKEYGFLWAVAKGVRLEKSKLRYSLTPFCLCEVSLVKGREVWRVTSASHVERYVNHISFLKKAATLIKRVSPEETPDRFLFDSLLAYFNYINEQKISPPEEAEITIALHILNRLGYIPSIETLKEVLAEPFNPHTLEHISGYKKQSIDLINQALRHAHL